MTHSNQVIDISDYGQRSTLNRPGQYLGLTPPNAIPMFLCVNSSSLTMHLTYFLPTSTLKMSISLTIESVAATLAQNLPQFTAIFFRYTAWNMSLSASSSNIGGSIWISEVYLE